MSSVAAARASPPPDCDLLGRIAAGDLSSLGVLFDRYARDLRRFIERLGVPPGDVDDLVQASFLVVVDAARGFHGEHSARPWLFSLAANVVRRHRRSARRSVARLTAWARQQYEHAVPTPGDSFELREGSARFAQALSRLSPKKREAFVMVVMEGLSAEATAEALGVPIGTVWTRLHHARRALRGCLDGGAQP
jgi:RNA polymerase sigma factor (sigma-70 family)